MRVTYVLPAPELGGGNKVAFQHARLLEEGGDEVTILGQGPHPSWWPLDDYRDLAELASGATRLPSQDLVVATYWTTVAVARELALGPVAHFCQGYEGSFTHLESEREAIRAAYSVPLPTLCVTPHLAALIADRYGRPTRVAPPPLDRRFRPRRFRSPRRRPWIAVPGIYEAEVKNVPTALAAVERLRAGGVAARLLRFSTHPIGDAERARLRADRELALVAPATIARVLAGADLLLLPSRAEEGFGLPLLEAMASGVPAVASRIPSAEFIGGGVVPLVDPEDPAAFAAAARELLGDRSRWREARERGLAEAERFAPERIAPELAAAVRWAAASPPAGVATP